jgi:aspartate racemase
MFEKTIGILGGMGPEATIDLFAKIVKGTKVRKDQDHLRVLIDNNPKIPDRTLAIQGKGPSPLPLLIKGGRALEKAGADFIVIPCVTAHHFYPGLQEKLSIPVLHIIEETMKHIRSRLKGIRRIGLVATTGTVHTGLFQETFFGSRLEMILPSAQVQKNRVMEAIYGKKGIKAIGPSPHSRRLVLTACQALIGQGAGAILAGCTEIPLVLKDGDLTIPVIDPISILARAAIERAGGRWRKA